MLKPTERAKIAIIGGSGIYDPDMLEDAKKIKVYTPFGKPSDMITIGTYHNQKIAFLPRHGAGHQIPPHMINYRANIWALKSLGVERILASSACGSLREDYKPGDIVILDQFIDRTKSRLSTFFEGGNVVHLSFAEPFCPELRKLLIERAKLEGIAYHPVGTYICIEGPRFSTKAESKMFQVMGADVIGMTLYPEIVLAREAQICYGSIALVTDYDCWKEHAVTLDDVLKTMAANAKHAKSLFVSAIKHIPEKRMCSCGNALKDAVI